MSDPFTFLKSATQEHIITFNLCRLCGFVSCWLFSQINCVINIQVNGTYLLHIMIKYNNSVPLKKHP